MLSVGPRNVALPIELSVELLMAVIELSDPLKASVSLLLGESAMSPGLLPALIMGTRALTSLEASTMMRPAVAKGDDTSCETNARDCSLVVVGWLRGALYPHDRAKQASKSTKTVNEICFKPGTPRRACWMEI
ncbi:MAG: hypothetical protein DMG72_15770 [Acidobacteria bacterium]|nr:MAG: hypothetical protein DMG72_15770 [Acidobacteriota bacterium]